ncbi:MAG: endonuclease [Calditrichia bacterium]
MRFHFKRNYISVRQLFSFCLFLLLPALSAVSLQAQAIFPGLYGQQLLDSLVANYKTYDTMDYNDARDVMFGIIDNHNDSVRCVYSGYMVYVNPDSSLAPRTQAYNNNPMVNTEHTWPKSLGAEGEPAESDLHHLFPTLGSVNAARGNLPFADIPDGQVNAWYRLNEVISSIPAQDIEQYSRLRTNTAFEPRLDHRGDVARAMFYFYTMYRSTADAAFFAGQKDVLRRWNMQDLVSPEEAQRTEMIAPYQDDKINPFIADTSLIARAYFTASGIASDERAGNLPGEFRLFASYPNPFNNRAVLRFQLPSSGEVHLTVFNSLGQIMTQRDPGVMAAGEHEVGLQADQWPSGFYFCVLKFGGERRIRKIVLMK